MWHRLPGRTELGSHVPESATCRCGLARQQGYLDGNKRTALAAALVFLKLNGRTLVAPGDELYTVTIAASTGEIGVGRVAEWVRGHV